MKHTVESLYNTNDVDPLKAGETPDIKFTLEEGELTSIPGEGMFAYLRSPGTGECGFYKVGHIGSIFRAAKQPSWNKSSVRKSPRTDLLPQEQRRIDLDRKREQKTIEPKTIVHTELD